MSTESIPAASGSQYVLVEDKIYRGDVHVATLQADGSVDYAPDMARYRAPVVKFLRESSTRSSGDALAGVSSPNAGEAEKPKQVSEEPPEVVPVPEEVPVIDSPEAFGREFEAIKHTERVVEPEQGSEPAPPAPVQDFRGDKTPAYVDWLWAHKPMEALSRYENRGALPGKSYEERRAALALAV